jgi:hypothetical protein
MHATCSAHFVVLDLVNLIVFGEENVIKFLMQFSPVSCYSLCLGSDILLSTPFSNTTNPCSSLKVVVDQVSHPYKTASKIRVLYILMQCY